MFLDAGGVIVLPHRVLVRAALARVGIEVDGSDVPRAHYRAVRALDRAIADGLPGAYLPVLCEALGIPPTRLQVAVGALSHLADCELSGEILWSEPVPGAQHTIDALERAGVKVVVVTNSDGHAAENLRDAGICQTTPGAGAIVADVVDSGLVGAAKPDPAIFRIALQRARTEPTAVVHVGDMVSSDVVGARAAGITPVHFDPDRRCRATDHRHIRSLSGIWRHVASTWRPGGPANRSRVSPITSPLPERSHDRPRKIGT